MTEKNNLHEHHLGGQHHSTTQPASTTLLSTQHGVLPLDFWLFAMCDGVSLDEMMILARKILREYILKTV